MRVHNPELISFDDSVLLLRHGTDLPVLRSDLNPPLDPGRIHEYNELANEVLALCEGKGDVRLFYSNRTRAKQSADILAEKLRQDARAVEMVECGSIREVNHGDFKIINYEPGSKYQSLVEAWTLWAEALADMDIDYRYGNPVRNGQVKYPSLVGIFTDFGENHREFTIRIYSFLVRLIEQFYSEPGVFNIVLAHQATLSRIQRVINALTLLEEVPDKGVLVRKIERASERVDIKESHGVVIRYPPKDFALCILAQEMSHLEA